MQRVGRLCSRVCQVSSPASSPVRRLPCLCRGFREQHNPPGPLAADSQTAINQHTRMLGGLSTAGSDTAKAPGDTDAFSLIGKDIRGLIDNIHSQLEDNLHSGNEDSELGDMSKYYFDGKGKSIRPVIALCIAEAFNHHTNRHDAQTIEHQRQVAIISEMIHTASLLHDDILDHAQTRRGKLSVNVRWDQKRSTMAGDYIIGVGSTMLAKIQHPDVIQILSQVLSDLVEGEFMQLQNKDDESERFEHYLNKSFNKTASLIAYTCKANVVLSGGSKQDIENSYQYGRHIGIAFQLVDDLLDFISSADQLGKPAAADLQLGLATAPVLFAARKFPELESLIARRFSQAGDVDLAYKFVLDSDGLDQTKSLAEEHCKQAVSAISDLTESTYKTALIRLADTVLNRIK